MAEDARSYNPKTLAFMGDAVYGLFVREKLILRGEKAVGELHSESIAMVCAAAQSSVYDKLLNILDENENNILKRGRNSSSAHVPKNADAGDYRKATGVEALFGYLYLSGRLDRAREIFEKIWEINERKVTVVCSEEK